MSPTTEQWPAPPDPDAFESLCLDLWQQLWGDPFAQKNGRRGQGQDGVDIFGEYKGQAVAVQCKQKDGQLLHRVTVAELEREVTKAQGFSPRLAALILATSGPRDRTVQRRARELSKTAGFRVSVWSWNEIWHQLYRREGLLYRIAPTYWPRLARLPRLERFEKGLLNEEIRTNSSSEKSLAIIFYSRHIQFREKPDSVVLVPWDPPDQEALEGQASKTAARDWKEVHRLAGYLVRSLLAIQRQLERIHPPVDAENLRQSDQLLRDIGRYLRRDYEALDKLATAVSSTPLVRGLADFRLMPNALLQDLFSAHNGVLTLRPSRILVERALEWALHSSEVADAIIQRHLAEASSA